MRSVKRRPRPSLEELTNRDLGVAPNGPIFLRKELSLSTDADKWHFNATL